MGGLERRLERLEAAERGHATVLPREVLRRLSDEDLDALEEALEAGQEGGEASFEDLYAAVKERSRRALDAYFETYEALSRGEEPPARDPPGGRDCIDLHERIAAGDEEARREYEGRNGYRIWKYKK